MKKIAGTALLFFGMAVFDQTKEDYIQFRKISTEILNNGKGYHELKEKHIFALNLMPEVFLHVECIRK
ncbi:MULTISPECIES: hypothetical protein [unclassified Chryseobacterium]|nr:MULTISPECIES: hypothetical protein [unclassified Chryseobacterium]PXW17692.1 hypothetical protein C8D70_10114 [Chryseobacterium sp. CBTAP 102]SIP96476.1 hypothetical protein SAMN05880573_101304 [Chryseobacterium sp. RU33C]